VLVRISSVTWRNCVTPHYQAARSPSLRKGGRGLLLAFVTGDTEVSPAWHSTHHAQPRAAQCGSISAGVWGIIRSVR
jgi:hypothetical protein